MAKKHEIEILISDEGEIKFHIKGMKGHKCVDIAKNIGKSLGDIEELNFTSEYYEKEKIEEKTKQRLK